MSFAQQLRNNYQKEQYSKPMYINHIIDCVRNEASRVSRTARSVSGYFSHGYEENELGNDPVLYLYETSLGRHEKAIKAYHIGNIYMYNVQDRDTIVEKVRLALLNDGFHNVIVRAEDTVKSFKIGHTEFLHRVKTVDYPAFKIYVSVSW